jgi:hypothetical protein
MKRLPPDPAYAVDDVVLELARRFQYPDADTLAPAVMPGGGGGVPTVVVAASDASELSKSKADFLCTGVDDNQIVQQAIDIVNLANGGTIWLTEGNFYYNGDDGDCTSLFSCNATIRGMGRPASLSNNRCTSIFVQGGDALTRGFAGGSEWFQICDLGFFGEDIGTAIDLGGGRVSNVYIQGFTIGVGLDTARLDGSWVHLCEYDVFCDQQVTIDHNVLGDASGFAAYAIGGFAGSGSMIVNNTIGDPGIGGLGGSLLGGIYLDQAADQTIIAGNAFYLAGDDPGVAVWLYGAYGCQIVDNYLDLGRSDGIVLDDTLNTVQNNIVACNSLNMEFPEDDNAYDGIRIDGNDNMIQHNMLRGSGGADQPRYGINIASGTNNIVVGNDFGALADWATNALNDAGTATRLVYPNDATYGDNFTL